MSQLTNQEVTPLIGIPAEYIDRSIRIGDIAHVLRTLPREKPGDNPFTQLLVGEVRVVPLEVGGDTASVRTPRTFHLGGVELVKQNDQEVSEPYADLILSPAKGGFSIWRQPTPTGTEPAMTRGHDWHQGQLPL